jgi:hypothetical protein
VATDELEDLVATFRQRCKRGHRHQVTGERRERGCEDEHGTLERGVVERAAWDHDATLRRLGMAKPARQSQCGMASIRHHSRWLVMKSFVSPKATNKLTQHYG